MKWKYCFSGGVLLSGLWIAIFFIRPADTSRLAVTNESSATGNVAVVWAQPVEMRFNLYRMGPDLYRSALPDKTAGSLLTQLGVTTVVNFYQRGDESWLSDPHIRQVHIPFHADRVRDEDVIRILLSIREAEREGGVLIHCKHGQSRTGLIAAMYRLVYQGWSKAQVLDEMRNGGFGGGERLSDAEEYIRQVDVAGIRSAIEGNRCSTSRFALCYLK